MFVACVFREEIKILGIFNKKLDAEREIITYYIYEYEWYSCIWDNNLKENEYINNFKNRIIKCKNYNDFINEFLEDLINLNPVEHFIDFKIEEIEEIK